MSTRSPSRALARIGQTAPTAARDAVCPALAPWQKAYAAASVAGVAAGAYHGYARNDSIGWAIWWAAMGGLFPFVTIPVSIAQGFGKRA
jgi:hypothetical protein